MVQVNKEIEPNFLNKLGGTISIVKVEKEISEADLKIENFLPLLGDKPKVIFGFSLYPLDSSSRRILKNLAIKLNRLGLDLKREIKSGGRSARFVTGKEPALSSVNVEKNNLIDESGEWVFMPMADKIVLGRTIAVQKSGWYSWRDFGRPIRDSKAGMLPPKLAKILVNISGATPYGLILDPFCGSGTILQEAGILGFQKVVGIDRDPKAVEASTKNWQWLLENKIISPGISAEFKLGDALHLAETMVHRSVGSVVTEGYLGPAGGTNTEGVDSLVEEISEVYLRSFQEFRKILVPGGTVVVTFPVYRVGKEEIGLPIVEDIEALGFKSKLALPSGAKIYGALRVTERGSVLYGRPDQKVWREVFVFSLTR